MKEIAVSLTEQEWQAVLDGLAEIKYKDAAPVIVKIITTVNPQLIEKQIPESENSQEPQKETT